jgi:dephospho-CoA kinase
MLRLGLTGGLATGKSFVAREFERLGCFLIYADKLGHDVMLPGGPAYQAIVNLFGPEILEKGSDLPRPIHRQQLGSIFFSNRGRLAQLNAIVHPAVFEREEALAADAAARDPHAIVIIEAAILIETGRHRTLDRLILTTCPEEIQIERAMKRDNLSRDEVLKRIQRQLPLSEKLAYADYVIDTGASKQETVARVHAVYDSLKDYERSLTSE